MNDRLAKVQPRTTCVIKLWIYGMSEFDDPASDTIGPFTRIEAERIATTLTCAHRIDRLTNRVPEWATESRVDPESEREALRRLAEGYEPH